MQPANSSFSFENKNASDAHVSYSSAFDATCASAYYICSASSQGASSGGFLVPASELLMVALTGTSAAEAFDQEGLEFLGDVVLKFLAASCVLQVGNVLPPWDTSTHHVGHGRFSGNLVH
jgi:dsRNA-specific ribonuclease